MTPHAPTRRIHRRAFVLAGLLALGAGTLPAQTTYVSMTGSDDDGIGDGSYAAPWRTISNAVAKTAAGTVLVATGQYVVSTRIAISKELSVRSWNEGAGGGEDPANTVIDGNEACSPLYLNHALARASGFTITRGNGARADEYNGRGGGALVVGGTLSNCIVVSNTAIVYGGGLSMSSQALVTDCTVRCNLTTSNTATYGGGIYQQGAGAGSVRNSWIEANRTRSYGGGLYLTTGAIVSNCHIVANTNTDSSGQGGGVNGGGTSGLVVDCAISNNNGAIGGGVAVSGTAFLTLRDSTITHNRANLSGAGATVMRSKTPTGGMLITNCLFQYNAAQGVGGYGAAISDGYQHTTANTSSGMLTVAHCRILNNGGTANDRYGAIWIWTHGTALVHHCTLASNSLGSSSACGGGLYIGTGSASVVVRNCLIEGNRATNSTSYGGGVFFGSQSCATRGPNPLDVRIESCTIAGNAASSSFGGLNVITNHTTIWNSVIAGNSADTYPDARGGAEYIAPFYFSCSPELSNAEQGNLTAAPVFESGAYARYRLAAGSPGLDAGANQAWMDGAVDLDGRARVDRFMRRADMGSYERHHAGALLSIR